MRATFSYTLILFASVLASAGHASEAVRDYPARQLSPHVWVIEGPLGFPSVENQGFMNNPAFVVTTEGVVVIDPGSSVQAGRMVMKQIRKVTDKPVTHVLDTHIHGDHWLGNQAITDLYPEAQLFAHPKMIQDAHEFAADQWLKIIHDATEGYTAETKAVIPENRVVDTDTLKVGNIDFRIYAPEAAHSGTDIMIEVVQDRLLFLGDNVVYQRIARLDDASFKGNLNACDVALATNARHYVPGHGPAGGSEVVEAYRDYLGKLYQLASEYYEEGLEDYEMKPKIIDALKPYSSWVNFDDEVGRHISLAILEYENSL